MNNAACMYDTYVRGEVYAGFRGGGGGGKLHVGALHVFFLALKGMCSPLCVRVCAHTHTSA